MTTERKNEIVVHIRRDKDRIIAEPLRVEAGESWPSNISYDGFGGEGLNPLADLQLGAWVSESYGCHALDADYRSVYTVDAVRAKIMVKMLDKIERAFTKDEAREHGDRLLAFCRAIGATRICWHDPSERVNWLKEHNWHWYSLPGGREALRHMIREAEKELVKTPAAA
jgi:hypothetical protein